MGGYPSRLLSINDLSITAPRGTCFQFSSNIINKCIIRFSSSTASFRFQISPILVSYSPSLYVNSSLDLNGIRAHSSISKRRRNLASLEMPSPPSSAYLTALTLEIERKLQRALALPTQRRDLLQELFADIALEVDDRAKEILFSSENLRSASVEKIKGPICYFDVLADHFVHVADSGKPILSLIVQLWSQQSFACHIFSLLFHKWLFEVELDKSESLLRYSSALVQGATDVFWIDVHSNTKCFQSLFRYLFEEVSLVPERLKKIPFQAQRNLFLLLSRFIFFYDLVDKLEIFLSQFPDFPNAVFMGGPADFFVTEVADQLQKLKVEPVLLHYLSQVKVLSRLELRMTTSTRLRTCLYSFTSPGAPMYPTRAVRHAAWDALDFLFPVGRYPRHLISIFFRLLYPWYWPSSFWNFIKWCVVALFYSVLRLIFSSRDKLKER